MINILRKKLVYNSLFFAGDNKKLVNFLRHKQQSLNFSCKPLFKQKKDKCLRDLFMQLGP